MIKAVTLFSGGLDSTLATKIVKDQGIEVTALHFYTGFCITEHKRKLNLLNQHNLVYENPIFRMAGEIEVPLELVDISDSYFNEVLKSPKYGLGKNVNPCIDCRIFMLKRAKLIMEEVGAQFIVTGEVMGQRPMTQFKPTLELIEKEAGLMRLILRPLSQKFLPETIPEEKGWIKREELYAIRGRGRKIQIALANEFGIKNYAQPAGGCCYLTDQTYARRYKEALGYQRSLSKDDLTLLMVGRHFRLESGVKVILGRNEGENRYLASLKRTDSVSFWPQSGKGPYALGLGELGRQDFKDIALLVARYTDKEGEVVEVIYKNGAHEALIVIPISSINEDQLKTWRI